MSTDRRLVALRGATGVATPDAAGIVAATAELLTELMTRNDVVPGDIVSILFTATPDLTAEFPAAAARKLGLDDVALLDAAEIAVPGAPSGIVRVLMHLYSQRAYAELRHVYLGTARSLRSDLAD
ncbi:MAG: chorismate mutase [Actinomycetota bacterium]|nr:chorismate mutase [Actinomycetota bacterium]